MSTPNALALIPLDERANARARILSAELVYAWDRTDAAVAREWSLSTAKTFGKSLKRRATNLFKLASDLGVAAAGEAATAVRAFREDRLAQHLGDRAGVAYSTSAELVTRVKLATAQAAQLVQSQPREAIPQLLVLVATSIVVSGGPDGDGGAPDLDLAFGIDAHRSILSHSVLMGAALETGFLSLVELVRLLHAKLPARHDPLWDEMVRHADSIAHSANIGASLGLSYHLLVDGLAQPAPYHDLPVSIPLEAHQSIFVANAGAEALDAGSKPRPGRVTSPAAPYGQQRTQDRVAATRRRRAPPWWEEAPKEEVAAVKRLHRRYRSESMLIEPFIADMLADDELLIIERYGAWLEALASGAVRPLSEAQERFLLVTRGRLEAETEHEQAWMMYQGLLAFAPSRSVK